MPTTGPVVVCTMGSADEATPGRPTNIKPWASSAANSTRTAALCPAFGVGSRRAVLWDARESFMTLPLR